MYSSDGQPFLQSLLRTLVAIDFAFERDPGVVQNSATDEVLKRMIVERLQKQHRAPRALPLRLDVVPPPRLGVLREVSAGRETCFRSLWLATHLPVVTRRNGHVPAIKRDVKMKNMLYLRVR
jgi:hypothetical protein